jgi:hypothetical protein
MYFHEYYQTSFFYIRHLLFQKMPVSMFGLITAFTRSANTYYQTRELLIAEIKGVSEQNIKYERK